MAGTAGMLDPDDAVYHNITQVETSSGISAGIRVRSLAAGLVPVFEEHDARKGEGYTLKEWYQMMPEERAMVVALYRISKAAEAHEMDAQTKAAARK
jgi:hypothetical protein